MRRDAFDSAAEDFVEDVVEELPESEAELDDRLPDGIDVLTDNAHEELASNIPEDVDERLTFAELLSDTPLEQYIDRDV